MLAAGKLSKRPPSVSTFSGPKTRLDNRLDTPAKKGKPINHPHRVAKLKSVNEKQQLHGSSEKRERD